MFTNFKLNLILNIMYKNKNTPIELINAVDNLKKRRITKSQFTNLIISSTKS